MPPVGLFFPSVYLSTVPLSITITYYYDFCSFNAAFFAETKFLAVLNRHHQRSMAFVSKREVRHGAGETFVIVTVFFNNSKQPRDDIDIFLTSQVN